MTHSLHRRGSVETLKDDYVFIARSSLDINRKGCGVKFQRIRQILHDAGPANAGSMETGGNIARGDFLKDWLARTSDDTIIAATFSSKANVRQVLQNLKREDLGISITISGLISEVFGLAKELGLKPHTVNLSLGVHGRTDLLPPEEILEVATMCGHALCSKSLVGKLKEDIAAGRLSLDEAARQMAEPCVCGIFNTERAAALLKS